MDARTRYDKLHRKSLEFGGGRENSGRRFWAQVSRATENAATSLRSKFDARPTSVGSPAAT